MKIIVVTTETGPIFVNADHILRLTPVDCGLELDMVDSQVFEIKETLEAITRQIDQITEADRSALVKAIAPLEALPPQPKPVAEGDAISREAISNLVSAWLLLAPFIPFSEDGAVPLKGFMEALAALPALPCAQPEAVDMVTAEDVVPGIEWGVRSSHWNKTASLSSNHDIYLEFCDGPDYLITKDQCVDLLNGALRRAETITFPEGHRRNPKPKERTYEKFDEFVAANRTLLSGWADDELINWYKDAPVAHKVATAETFAQLPREVKIVLCANTAALNDCKFAIERERKEGGE
jgi:hypothetical protein